MSIRLNSNRDIVNNIKSKLAENKGYCPCSLKKDEDTKCMCKEFREQVTGYCHCGLYYKTTN